MEYNIPGNTWKTYYETLSGISEKAAERMLEYIQKHGLMVTKEFIDYAYALTSHYGEAAGELASQMYDYCAEYWTKAATGEKVYKSMKFQPAEPAQTASYGEVAKTMKGIAKSSENPNSYAYAVGRMVKQTAEDTTLKNAARDGAEFAWVPNGDTCAFCIMLASNGWKRMSKKALKGGHAEHIHANCDCTYAVRFDGKGGVPGYDPDKYLEIYENAEGSTWQEKLNSMRRDKYDEDKEKILKKKRENYHLPENEMLRMAKNGNTFINRMDDLYEYAKKIEQIEGFEDIVAHGDAFSVVFRNADGVESNVSAEEFANILEKGGTYKGGKIRLIACETGAGDGIVPTYLARRFNTEVLAPTEIVNVDWNGKIILANDENNAKMKKETGEWILFGPKGRIK